MINWRVPVFGHQVAYISPIISLCLRIQFHLMSWCIAINTGDMSQLVGVITVLPHEKLRSEVSSLPPNIHWALFRQRPGIIIPKKVWNRPLWSSSMIPNRSIDPLWKLVSNVEIESSNHPNVRWFVLVGWVGIECDVLATYPWLHNVKPPGFDKTYGMWWWSPSSEESENGVYP